MILTSMSQLKEIDELAYLSQQTLLGEKNHAKLRNSKVTIVGAGGTGSFAANLLAKLGVAVRVIDPDFIDPTNLSRQNLYSYHSVGNSKVQELKKQLLQLNPLLSIQVIEEKLDESNAKILLKDSDIVLDCSDNYEARNAIDTYCYPKKIPWVYCAAIKNELMLSTFLKGASLSFAKVFPKPTQCLSCSTEGVIVTTVSTAASLAVQETVNTLLGKSQLAGKILKVNLSEMQFKTFELT